MTRFVTIATTVAALLAGPIALAGADSWTPATRVVSDAPTAVSFVAAADPRAPVRQVVVVRAGRAGEPLRLFARDALGVSFAPVGPVRESTARSVQPSVALGAAGGVVAWRQDTPRAYTAVRVVTFDPVSGTFGATRTVADAHAGGVRHPAVAIDASGNAVLALLVRTRDVHLNQTGRVAVSVRRAGGAFSRVRVVTGPGAGAPAVAMAGDRAVVAWIRAGRVEAVSVDRGRVGAVRILGRGSGLEDPDVAVGPQGRAAVVWTQRSRGHGRVRVATRGAAGALRDARTLRSSSARLLRGATVAVAADGRALAGWTEEDYTRLAQRRPRGSNGIYARVRVARGSTVTGGFTVPESVSPATGYASPPSIAAIRTAGLFAVTWSWRLDDARSGVQAAFAGRYSTPAAQPIGPPLKRAWEVQTRPVSLDAPGGATVLWTADEARSVLVADGRPG